MGYVRRTPAARRKLAACIERLEQRRLLAAFLVDITADENDGNYAPGDLSLREAIALANASEAEDTITFDTAGVFASPQTITLVNGALPITSSLTITGTGAVNLTIDGNDTPGTAFLVITNSDPLVISVEITALTLTGGQGGSGGAIFNQETLRVDDVVITGNMAAQGGGIYNSGTLTLSNSTLSANHATGSGWGGAVYLPAGVATITNCTLSGNSANSGGGIANRSTLTLTNSTLCGNFTTGTGSQGSGGGIWNDGPSAANLTATNCTIVNNIANGEGGGGIFNSENATLTNCTISANRAGSGGSVYNFGGLTLNNTIVANSLTVEGNPGGLDVRNFGTVVGSNNLVEDGSDGLGDSLIGDPNLGSLAFNGGPTRTMALNAGSAAIDAGSNAKLPQDTLDLDGDADTSEPLPVDQRGLPFARVFGDSNTVDIGAFEVQAGDSDGVPDATEDAGPNGGDGNYDGTPDSEQPNVTSLPNSANGQYVTLQSPSGSNLADVAAVANPSPSDAPKGVKFPVGFLDFTVEGITPGAATTVILYLPDDTKVSAYYKYGGEPGNTSPHWYNFNYNGTTGAQIFAGIDADTDPEQIVLHFVDGQRGDDDLLANGQVVDPGTPVFETIPTAGISGPTNGPLNQSLNFTLSANDDSPEDQAAGFTFALDWDGNGTTDQIASGMSGIQVTRAYPRIGVYTVSMTAEDQNGDVSDPVTMTVTIRGAQVVTDPFDPARSALIVGGTSGNDTILFRPVRGSSKVQVLINNVSQGSFNFTGSLIAFGQDGDDSITVDAKFSRRNVLYGNVGNDTLTSGNGPSILLGGDGNDLLTGGNRRDILIGGAGADRLRAGNDEDILIAGATSYDADTIANQQSLSRILAEWLRTDLGYDARANHLFGTTAGGLNGAALLTTSGASRTVFDDTSVDQLTGDLGRDWYFANLAGGTADQLFGKLAAERLEEL